MECKFSLLLDIIITVPPNPIRFCKTPTNASLQQKTCLHKCRFHPLWMHALQRPVCMQLYMRTVLAGHFCPKTTLHACSLFATARLLAICIIICSMKHAHLPLFNLSWTCNTASFLNRAGWSCTWFCKIAFNKVFDICLIAMYADVHRARLFHHRNHCTATS